MAPTAGGQERLICNEVGEGGLLGKKGKPFYYETIMNMMLENPIRVVSYRNLGELLVLSLSLHHMYLRSALDMKAW